MATPQEAKPDASSELPGDSPAIAGNTAQPQANAGAPSTEAIKADLPLGEASSHDTAGRAAPIEMVADAPSEAAEEPAAAGGAAAVAAPARSSRFALLAASLALAAGLGAVVGSLSASGLAHLSPVAAAAPKSGMAEANALQAVKAELAELSALKASLDGAARNANGQFAKIVDRLDRVERAQIEPAAKIAHMAEAIDRLEKKNVTAAALRRARDDRRHRQQTAGGARRGQAARQDFAELGRAGRAKGPRAGREQLRRRVRRCGRQRAAGSRRCRVDQAPGRPMGGRHRARHHYRTLTRIPRASGEDA